MNRELAVALPARGHYIVAVSGGVDSVALLHLLLHQPEHDLRLRVAHVNHGLRPDADSDERFVRGLANVYGLPFDSVQLKLGQASEAESRGHRYKFLTELMQAHHARAIITAHHSGDQLETSLLNTLRGSGRHGQAASLKHNQILRPLLSMSKSDLTDYAKSHGLVWREDTTNQDRTVDRNFIRHELLHDEPDYSDHHRALMVEQARLNKHLDSRLQKLYYTYRTETGLELPRAWLAQESWPVLAAFWHFVLRTMAPDQEFSRVQIEGLVRMAKTAPAGTEMSLSNRLKLEVGYDIVAIVAGAVRAAPLLVCQLIPETSLDYGPFRLSYGSNSASNAVTLPGRRHFVRSAKSGDRMQTAVGTKKVQDIFVDKKVPRSKRPSWPLITNDQDQILWLPRLSIDPSLTTATEGYQLIAEER